jgi:hypothetical protein
MVACHHRSAAEVAVDGIRHLKLILDQVLALFPFAILLLSGLQHTSWPGREGGHGSLNLTWAPPGQSPLRLGNPEAWQRAHHRVFAVQTARSTCLCAKRFGWRCIPTSSGWQL